MLIGVSDAVQIVDFNLEACQSIKPVEMLIHIQVHCVIKSVFMF